MVVEYELTGIKQTAKELVRNMRDKKVLAFHGEMGAGKTTLIHAICDELGVTDVVGSPTFSIINEYKSGNGEVIFHLDLYRLKDEAEAIDAGVEDCLDSGSLCLVEWPENAAALFPGDTVHCYLKSTGNNERILRINL
jgi:tRNA threonylcarbamoyladenosine biosynthesis protein TsaE